METIGDRIKELRKKEGLNQNKFCEIINLGQSRLSEIESNKTKPSFETLLSIKENFHVSLDWLATGEIQNISENVYPENAELSPLELKLIDGFRELSEKDKKEVVAFVKLKKDLEKKNAAPPSSTLRSEENGSGEEAATSEAV